MTRSVRSRILRVPGHLLLLLGMAPVTAPFSTRDPADLLGRSVPPGEALAPSKARAG